MTTKTITPDDISPMVWEASRQPCHAHHMLPGMWCGEWVADSTYHLIATTDGRGNITSACGAVWPDHSQRLRAFADPGDIPFHAHACPDCEAEYQTVAYGKVRAWVRSAKGGEA